MATPVVTSTAVLYFVCAFICTSDDIHRVFIILLLRLIPSWGDGMVFVASDVPGSVDWFSLSVYVYMFNHS
jgi:hypothetical protein